MSKAIKNVGKDIKAGFKNIPTMYKTLYNQGGVVGGPGKTIKTNVRIITTGKPISGAINKATPGTRARTAIAGITSVTPIGPITAFALGVQKSKNDRMKAKTPTTNKTPKVINIKPKATKSKTK